MLAAEGIYLGRSISGLNFDRRTVRILAPFGKLDGMGTGEMISGEVIWIWNCGMIWVVVDVDGRGA